MSIAAPIQSGMMRDQRLEARTREIGRQIFARVRDEQPMVGSAGWWDEKMMGLSMRDEGVKIQLFRFVDALPALRTPRQIAVYHAMGSLECVARDLTGDSKATLGEALKRYPGLLPKPLDTALAQIWGYASNEARHVQEGRQTSREEAELLVGLAAALSTYLTRKQIVRGNDER